LWILWPVVDQMPKETAVEQEPVLPKGRSASQRLGDTLGAQSTPRLDCRRKDWARTDDGRLPSLVDLFGERSRIRLRVLVGVAHGVHEKELWFSYRDARSRCFLDAIRNMAG